MARFTELLERARAGDVEAHEEIYDAAYEQLRRLARTHLRRSGSGSSGTIQTTALIHEAYLKLCDGSTLEIRDRRHFFALSARAMRQLLVDHFRHKAANKRGGRDVALSLDEELIPIRDRGEAILIAHESLEHLSRLDERLGRVVEYKFFAGLTLEEIAGILGLTTRTVSNDWRRARAWLARELQSTAPRTTS